MTKEQAIDEFNVKTANFAHEAVIIGGSNLYGLSNDESDFDFRGVFSLGGLDKILGLSVCGSRKFETSVIESDEIDAALYEIRKFLCLLAKTNTQVLELLYADTEEYIYLSPSFQELRACKERLIDSDRLFKSLMGYIQGEKRLMSGERTGQLGSKRKGALAKYGYSYKNLVQILRLSFCGQTLFTKGYYPVNVKKECPNFAESLMNIKNDPASFDLNQANKFVEAAEKRLTEAYDNTKFSFDFDEDFARSWINSFYQQKVATLPF